MPTYPQMLQPKQFKPCSAKLNTFFPQVLCPKTCLSPGEMKQYSANCVTQSQGADLGKHLLLQSLINSPHTFDYIQLLDIFMSETFPMETCRLKSTSMTL